MRLLRVNGVRKSTTYSAQLPKRSMELNSSEEWEHNTSAKWHGRYREGIDAPEDWRESSAIRGRKRDSERTAGQDHRSSEWNGDKVHCGLYMGYSRCDCPCHGSRIQGHHSCAAFLASVKEHECKAGVPDS